MGTVVWGGSRSKECAIMREWSDFSNGWKMSALNTEQEKQYDESVVQLPYIHEAADFTDLVFTNRFSATDKLEGETLYLEFRQVSGTVKVWNGETPLGERTGMVSSFRAGPPVHPVHARSKFAVFRRDSILFSRRP